MRIRFVSDYVCPYCYASKLPLQAYLKDHPEIEIEWVPFELTRPPKERVDTYHDPVRRARFNEHLAPLGLGMKLPPNVVPRPYTTLAFEGYHFAVQAGAGEAYNDAVYRAYFLDEKDIGEINVLTEIASSCGMDADAFRAALADGTWRETEENAARYSRDVLGVTSVPTIFLDDEKIVGGPYDVDGWKQLIEDRLNAAPGFSCGSNGCGPVPHT